MLGRAARSRLPPVTRKHKYLENSYNELYLPWLCPSLYTSILHSRSSATVASHRTTNPSAPSKFRPVKTHEVAPCAARRGLASAATETYGLSPEDHIPFADGLPFIRPLTRPSPGSFVDNPAPLVLESACTTAPATFRTFNAITGELGEIHQTLHACLQVGRLERAAALMRRLNQLYKPDAPGLLAAHNEYLRELSWRLTREHDQEMLKGLQKWFEVNIRGNGVTPDATTYALMIQASLQGNDRKKLARTTQRYLQFAKEGGIYDETIATTVALLQADQSDKFAELVPDPLPKLENKESIAPSPENTTAHLYEVKSVEQKGLGLSSLRHSLSMFSDSAPAPLVGEHEGNSPDSVIAQNELRQRRLERDTFESAINRWREENALHKKIGVDSALSSVSLGALMWTWHEALVPLIEEEVRMANEAESKPVRTSMEKEKCHYGPFLQFLSAEKLSAATILTAMSTLSTEAELDEGVKLVYLVMKIGSNVMDESIAETVRIQAQRSKKDALQVHDRVAEARTAIMKTRNPRSSFARLFNPGLGQRTSQLVESLMWSKPLQAKIGSVLLSRLMEVAKIEVTSTRTGQPQIKGQQPVFFHTFQYAAGKRSGVVRLNKAIIGKLTKEPIKSVISKHLPMVVEPKPWTAFRSGGFLEHSIPVLRIRSMDLGRRYAITASDNGDMDQTFAGLTVLGKTPWRVNRPVFETMLEVWNSGDAIAKIPADDPHIELPPEPSKDLLDYPAQRLKWLRQCKTLENYRSGLKTNRCFLNFQLEIARAYIDETFYFPHNVDFRGRAYPMSPLFNHIGADNVRGLLIFAEGKELGNAGLRWLKIHLANLFGYDKASFTEREHFATDHLSNIYESAENPLGGRRWWLKAEDPWQCLAACIELKNALDSPDPHRFVSHLAIHQDGTCNGLQHYAALGGDSLGAKQVNLEPGDRPSDIYTAVAELVKAEVSKDAAHGDATAAKLNGRITRKVVKQTVMTNVYGVTFLGAQRQVYRQLDPIFKPLPETDQVNLVEASRYIARKIFHALSTIFNGAHDIQYWLGDCASRISESLSPEQIDSMLGNIKEDDKNKDYKRAPSVRKAIEGPNTFKTPVIWTNPLRMPVVQPYRKAASQRVSTHLQTISLQVVSPSDPVSKQKQHAAFPPNFIHSLDASHMILTALKCNEKGLTFASVHDSFWTHAADVDVMNGIIRDSFVRMHSENIVDRLAAEFSARYKDYIQLASVKKSSAIGRKIEKMRKATRGTTRFNSTKAMLEELQTERLRCKLLASDNPSEQQQGASMVTAASIFEQSADEKELLPKEDLKGGIGQLPSVRDTKLQANEQLEVGDLDNAKLLDPATDDFELDAERHNEHPTWAVDAEPPAIEGDTEKRSTVIRRKFPRTEPNVRFWLPMTFPPVPKKGDFDVSRLKDSQYFFS